MTRLVAYVDMNAYFASIEQQSNPALRGKPIAVGGRPNTRSVVTTASYEARRYGVKTGMSTGEAVTRCSSLILVPANYAKYQDFTRRLALVAEMFSSAVELCSIDELALDIDHYLVEGDPAGTSRRIHAFVQAFKAAVSAELGEWVTASIGIGPSSVHAKIAAEQRKPDGVFVIAPTVALARECMVQGLPSRTWTQLRQLLPLEAVPGIGRRLTTIIRAAGFMSLEVLAKTDEGTLVLRFGILGAWLSRIAQGRWTNTVHAFRSDSTEQSMSHQITLPRDVPLSETRPVFFSLADRVVNRLYRSAMAAHTVFVGFGRTNSSGWYTRQRSHQPMQTTQDVFNRAWQLIQRTWHYREPLVRRPTIGVTNLVSVAAFPAPLFPLLAKRVAASNAMYSLRAQYGRTSIQPATALLARLDHIPDGRRVGFHSLAEA